MNLMLLKDGGLSLEFAESDFEEIGKAMRELGEVRREQGVTHVNYVIDGARLVFLNDWDDPCLIAGDEAGTKLLKALFDRLISRASNLRHAA